MSIILILFSEWLPIKAFWINLAPKLIRWLTSRFLLHPLDLLKIKTSSVLKGCLCKLKIGVKLLYNGIYGFLFRFCFQRRLIRLTSAIIPPFDTSNMSGLCGLCGLCNGNMPVTCQEHKNAVSRLYVQLCGECACCCSSMYGVETVFDLFMKYS